MSTKIQKLLSDWPTGAVRTVRALTNQGYSHELINHYRKSNWLKKVGDGAVSKQGDEITIYGGIYALQEIKIPVRVGGLSALELLGRAHYLRLKNKSVHLFGNVKRLPQWFLNYDWGLKIEYHSTNLIPEKFNKGLKKYKHDAFSIWISNEIQAFAEFLSLTPQKHSIEEAKELMMTLNTLRPEEVQKTLEVCTSFKVKRLFLLLAEQCNNAWVKRLDLTKISLGTGKISLTKGGRYHSKFKMTLPSPFVPKKKDEGF